MAIGHTPFPKMMTFKATLDHICVDIATQTQFEPQTARVLPDFLFDTLTRMNHMSNALRFPFLQQHQQFLIRPTGLSLCKVQRDAQVRTLPSGFLKGRLQDLNPSSRWVSTQIDAYNALVLELRC